MQGRHSVYRNMLSFILGTLSLVQLLDLGKLYLGVRGFGPLFEDLPNLIKNEKALLKNTTQCVLVLTFQFCLFSGD